MNSNAMLEKDELVSILSRINGLLKRQESQLDEVEVAATDQHEFDDEIPVLTEIYRGVPLEAEVIKHGNEGISAIDKPHDLDAFQLEHSSSNHLEQGITSEQLPLSPELVERFLYEMQPLILKAVKLAVLEESVKAEQVLTQKLEQEILLLLRDRLATGLM